MLQTMFMNIHWKIVLECIGPENSTLKIAIQIFLTSHPIHILILFELFKNLFFCNNLDLYNNTVLSMPGFFVRKLGFLNRHNDCSFIKHFIALFTSRDCLRFFERISGLDSKNIMNVLYSCRWDVSHSTWIAFRRHTVILEYFNIKE